MKEEPRDIWHGERVSARALARMLRRARDEKNLLETHRETLRRLEQSQSQSWLQDDQLARTRDRVQQAEASFNCLAAVIEREERRLTNIWQQQQVLRWRQAQSAWVGTSAQLQPRAAIVNRFFLWILTLYPPSFILEHGDEMIEDFDDGQREHRSSPAWSGRELARTLLTALGYQTVRARDRLFGGNGAADLEKRLHA